MLEVVLPIVMIVLLVAVNGVFVAAEFALVGARRSRLETRADAGSASARWLLRVFDEPTGKDRYIAIAQLGITLASIGLGMYGEPAIARWLYGPIEGAGVGVEVAHTVGFAIALGFITFLHVVFGEMIPKALALQAPEAVVTRVNPVMRIFGWVFRPMVHVLNWLALALMRLVGIREPARTASLYTSQELMIVTEEAAHSGQLDSVQNRLIHNIFELEDRTAEQLMTSRHRLRTLDVSTPAAEVARVVATRPLSRYPVVDGSLDRVLGVVHIKDFIRARTRDGEVSLAALVRELPTVIASTNADELLELFKRSHVHAALVIDEFGGTLGFVTLEDLIADVIDEEDAVDEAWIHREPDGSLLLDGEVTLAELREDHDLPFGHAEVETVAGLFLADAGRVPAPGDAIEVDGYRLAAEEVRGLKITRVRVWPTRRDEAAARS